MIQPKEERYRADDRSTNDRYSCVGIGGITINAKDVLIEWKMEKFGVEHHECD